MRSPSRSFVASLTRLLRKGEQGGQALVEFALLLAPLALIIVAIVEFGFFYQARSAVRDGVRAAARQASLCRSWTSSSPSPNAVYTGIVSSSMSSPPTLQVTYSGSTTESQSTCVAGAPVIAQTSSTYSVSILGINIPLGSLNQQAEAIVE